jgi:hypothetical protein
MNLTNPDFFADIF